MHTGRFCQPLITGSILASSAGKLCRLHRLGAQIIELESFNGCVNRNGFFVYGDGHNDNSVGDTDFGSIVPVLRTMTLADVVTSSLVVPLITNMRLGMTED